ncbi:hypothetical protein ACLB2K_069337 [Fragaria x ananassa]
MHAYSFKNKVSTYKFRHKPNDIRNATRERSPRTLDQDRLKHFEVLLYMMRASKQDKQLRLWWLEKGVPATTPPRTVAPSQCDFSLTAAQHDQPPT